MSAHVVAEPYETRADGGRRGAGGKRIYRHVNERIRELWRSYDAAEPVQLFCECAARGCTETLVVDAERFDDVRRERRFIVAPGHLGRGEAVVERTRGYWLVEERR